MNTVYMMKGLPASGKTTRTRDMVLNGAKRVSKDDLREMLDLGKYNELVGESVIREIRDLIIRKCVVRGYDVVVDDCNLNPVHERQIKSLADDIYAHFVVISVNTPVEECVQRDATREKSVGEQVIQDMYSKYMDKK